MAKRDQGSVDCGFVEVEDISTTSGSLVDITGCSVAITLNAPGRLRAIMCVETDTTGGGATGAWAIELPDGAGGVADTTEIKRRVANSGDVGSLAVQGISPVLEAGDYTVKGRHRRVTAINTVLTGVAQLCVHVVDE